MGRKAEILVKESISDLSKLKNKQTKVNMERRVNALIQVKKQVNASRKEVAQYLGIGKRTLEKWLSTYKHEGLEALLEVKPRRKGSKLISPQVHAALKDRLEDCEQGFLGYWDAHRWIQEEHEVKISYFYLRRYLINHFGTKIKSPRKSHIKKDKGAETLFKKPTR